mmetsp:Transcript_28709/g.31725  ORF Transcript_28709/g.31725 Transcript_28709/m.31725 type:complete len:128 (+) Transcript_28709:397-780(+)
MSTLQGANFSKDIDKGFLLFCSLTKVNHLTDVGWHLGKFSESVFLLLVGVWLFCAVVAGSSERNRVHFQNGARAAGPLIPFVIDFTRGGGRKETHPDPWCIRRAAQLQEGVHLLGHVGMNGEAVSFV